MRIGESKSETHSGRGLEENDAGLYKDGKTD